MIFKKNLSKLTCISLTLPTSQWNRYLVFSHHVFNLQSSCDDEIPLPLSRRIFRFIRSFSLRRRRCEIRHVKKFEQQKAQLHCKVLSLTEVAVSRRILITNKMRPNLLK